MKERPILFNGAMVRAERAGLKIMTRRLVKNVGEVRDGIAYRPEHSGHGTRGPFQYTMAIPCPYGVPGDRLWVRETWAPCDGGPIFAADYDGDKAQAGVERWHPGIHLRREDARTLLEVTAVRVERLQDITEEDAEAEGVAPLPCHHADCDTGHHRTAFAELWDEINGERATWASNPWVWVVSFQRVAP